MNINIRRAVKEDCLRMMELVQELAVYEKEPEAVTVPFDHFVESGFGDKPIWWAFVAEAPYASISSLSSPTGGDRGGLEVVGFALWYIRYSTWKGQRMYLEDLLVTENMRGKGIGKLLFDRLIEECKEKKYSGMAWQVLGWNEPAINFYKKYPGVQFDAGWTNCMINF
ncbi:MAG: GNAT family N-acetyltransferase [Chitinophagaceae bacterium]|nr:GNAT family N-acetyltransferase [Chitinophagaceae bacterium]MBL0055983.1 GNAT family N-acetyltransferase [Chitinophagaceae bacterium]